MNDNWVYIMFGFTWLLWKFQFSFPFFLYFLSSQTKFFFFFLFLIYHLFNFFKIKDGFVHMDFGLCAAGTQGLDFRKNTKKKSSAKKLHRTDSSPTAYDWFSILSLSYIYIYMYVCMYACFYHDIYALDSLAWFLLD